MQGNRDEDNDAALWHAAALPIGTVLLVTMLLAVDELNPVKVLCSYTRFYDDFLSIVTEGRIACAAALLLLVLVVNERQHLLYYLARIFFRCTFNNMFFRSVEIVGMEHLPRHGPVILTGNHNNQFADGLALLANSDREISFMIAKKSWERPVVGFLARAFHCIPVTRPQDSAFRGDGRVNADGTATLRGESTRFSQQVEPGAHVQIGGHSKLLKVKEVLSDTELLLDGEVEATQAASGDTYKVHPKVDQSAMYDQVYDGLRKGKCLGIFPEGGSHDRTDLLPLKAGVALIALDAFTKHHMVVPIVPVGLNYFHGHRFGGRVVVEFGPPIVVPENIYIQNETDRRGATEALLQLIATGMRSVIVPTPDYHMLQMIYMVRRLYVPDGLKLSAEQTMDLNRRFAVGIQRILDAHSKMQHGTAGAAGGGKDVAHIQGAEVELSPEDHQAIDEFKTEVEAYMATLKRLGLRDHQVRQIGWWGVPDLVGRLMYLVVTMMLGAIPQLLFNVPVMIIASKLAATEQQKSLKASSVKLAARDVVMSYKIIYTLVLIPCLYVFYGTLLVVFTRWCTTSIVLVLAILPFFAFLGTKASEQGVRAYADIVPLFKRLLPETRKDQDALPAQRAALQKRLNHAVKKFGPLLGDLYQMKSVDWAKEMGWFTHAAARLPGAAGPPGPEESGVHKDDEPAVVPEGTHSDAAGEDHGLSRRAAAGAQEEAD